MILAPHLELHFVSIDLRDLAMAAVGTPGHIDAAIAHLERLERAAVTEPVGHQLAQERGFEQAVEDDAGQADALRVLLVVMDLVCRPLLEKKKDQLPPAR